MGLNSTEKKMITSQPAQVKISSARPYEERCDALILFVPQEKHEHFEVFRIVDQKLRNALSKLLKAEHFVGKIGETITYHTNNPQGPARVVLTGLGRLKDCSEEMFRRASGAAAIAARRAACSRVSYTMPSELNIQMERLLQAIVEGALLGSYRFLKFKTKEEEIEPEKKIDSVSVLTDSNSLSRGAMHRAELFAQATCFAR